MIAEHYTGQLYLAAKTRPVARTAHDGTFCLTLLAYSRPIALATVRGGARLVPWRISYFGDAALGFWCHFGADLLPGAVLSVNLTNLQLIEGSGRHCAAEIHAHINGLQVLAKEAKQHQNSCIRPTANADAACLSSY